MNDSHAYIDPRSINSSAADKQHPWQTRSHGLKCKRSFSLISPSFLLPNPTPITGNPLSDPVPIRSSKDNDSGSSISSSFCTPSPPKITDFTPSSSETHWSSQSHSVNPIEICLFDLLNFCHFDNVLLPKIPLTGINVADAILRHGIKVIPAHVNFPWAAALPSQNPLSTGLGHLGGAFRPVLPRHMPVQQPVVLMIVDAAEGSPFTNGQILVELSRVSLISGRNRDATGLMFLFENTIIRTYEDETVNELSFVVATPDPMRTRLSNSCLEVLEFPLAARRKAQVLPLKVSGFQITF